MPKRARTFKPAAARIDRRRLYGEKRDSAYRRGYGGKGWERLRAAVFVRDGYICRDCGVLCREKPADEMLWPNCDHIVPKVQGGLDDMDNLQTLCGSCHSKKTMKER